MDIGKVKFEVNKIADQLILFRRHFHSHPELSFEEKNTAAYISNLLDSWNIPHQTNVGGYGIVGLIAGKNPDNKVIALRADMDALPVKEENNVEYCSLNEGVMHACGHDVHMACLLGVIKILSKNTDWFEGTIKFIFQPAEETLPGGAIKMIEAGVLENPTPELIIGQHVLPELETGKVGYKKGVYMASSDELNLTVTGRGGHGAIPVTFDDTVLAAAEIIVDIKRKVQQLAPLGFPTVLSFGKVIADGTYNVIPSEVKILGTFRTFNEEWRQTVHRIIVDISTRVSAKYKTKCDVFINNGYPVLVNNDSLTGMLINASEDYLGKQKVDSLDFRTTVEDFARFTQIIPGCYYRLGVGNPEKGITSNLHSATFNIDERALEIGTGMLIWNALSALKSQ